jgi:hypothetical protein
MEENQSGMSIANAEQRIINTGIPHLKKALGLEMGSKLGIRFMEKEECLCSRKERKKVNADAGELVRWVCRSLFCFNSSENRRKVGC